MKIKDCYKAGHDQAYPGQQFWFTWAYSFKLDPMVQIDMS